MIRNGDCFNDHGNVPYFGLLVPQTFQAGIGSAMQSAQCSSGSGSSSSTSSFPNGFLSPEESGSPYAEKEKRITKNDREMFNDVRVPTAPYFIPISRTLQSPEGSPPLDLFPNGFSSQYMAPISEESKYQTGFQYSNGGLRLDSKSPRESPYKINERLVGEMDLSQRFSGISMEEELDVGGAKMKGFDVDSDGFGFGFNDNVQYHAKKYGSCWDFNNGAFINEGFQSSLHGVSYSNYDDLNSTITVLPGGLKRDSYNSLGSSFAHNLPNNICSGSAWYSNQSDYLLEQRKEKGESWINWDSQSQNPSMGGPYLVDPPIFSQPINPNLDMKVHDAISKNFGTRGIPNNEFSHIKPMKCAGNIKSLGCEDSFIIRGGKGLNHHFYNRGCGSLFSSEKRNDLTEISVQKFSGKSIKLDNSSHDISNWVTVQKPSSYTSVPMAPSIDCLREVQGNVYLIAQDQNGCRWLQRIFDEGTKDDIQIIFKEIVGHVVELMLKPFGNYVIQKFLDVCDEKQRLKIVMNATEEPGRLVRICLNTYGTRAVQKLIETLKTRQQIHLVIMSLKPGFLDLVKDQNGNHVIQRCLQCLNDEDNKFIFDAAARFCVEIATHRHGCCVMQRCITHSTGRSREKLVTEISKNSLLLAQDPFGNYVVQYIVELKCPSAVVNLLSQFESHYVQLSMQKFSSHVVEKCLNHLEESREQIVHELISVSRFEQLVQDPFANYVIQSALAVTQGALHSLLVDAVRPHMILRSNPYSKRIFSRNLLKK